MPVRKTTLYLDEDLHARLKAIAARERRTLTDVVQDGLREFAYARRPTAKQRRRLQRQWAELGEGLYAGEGTAEADAHDDIYD